VVETGLAGWAGRIRTAESVRELCLCDFVVTYAGSVTARRQRPFAFELVRREYTPGRFFGSKSGVLSPHDANNATVVAAYPGHLRIGRPGALANY